jgi:ribitol 2-dehydrogenase
MNPLDRLHGKNALVTGASRGIGESVARLLAAAGARVFGMARTSEPLEALARETGGEALIADLTDDDQVQRAASQILEQTDGAIDVLVNAAGVFGMAPLVGTETDFLAHNLAVNLTGTFRVIRAVLPTMIERGTGDIVTVGSVAGRTAFPENGAYSASKFGLRGLHEVLLEELRGTGVRACLIEPGAVDTTIWDSIDPDSQDHLPSRWQMLRTEDVAQAVLFATLRPAGVRVPLIQIERG